MIRQLLSLLFLLLVSTPTLLAQSLPSQPSALHQLIPPSPTAASLGVYGEVGVGYFTGLPDISIPLYEVNERSIALPIRLQYNASGTRVAENASWVGLGWSLAAGGVITRTVRGLDDFKNNGGVNEGYYNGPPLPAVLNYTPPNKPSASYDKSYFKGIQNGVIDAEPDIFAYNFGSYSGKFVLGKKRDGSLVFVDEQNNLRIEYVPAGWRITDAKGYQYLFSDSETTSSYSYSSSSSEAPNDIALRDLTYQPDKATVTTAWYLSRITAPTGEVLLLEYGRGESLSLLNKAEEEYNLLNLNGGCEGSASSSSRIKGTYKVYSASKQVIADRYLRKITFSHGTVEFNTSEREDIEYRDATLKPAKLAEIVVKNESGKVMRSFRFRYSYFGKDGLQRRLKLDAVSEVGQDGASKPPYQFEYHGGEEVFYDKYSKSVDHWGYYNGRGNTGLLPSLVAPDYNKFVAGADRRPDVTHSYPKQGVLAAITYPTGGRTRFDYELHDYATSHPDYQDVPRSASAGLNPRVSSEVTGLRMIQEFDIVAPADVPVFTTVNYSYSEAGCREQGSCELSGVIYGGLFFLEKQNGASWERIYTATNSFPPAGEPFYMSESGSTKEPLPLKAGHYRVSVWHLFGYALRIDALWSDRVYATTVNKYQGGGLRIKTITSFDGDKQVRQQKFIYTANGTPQGVSSGVLLTNPIYDLRVTQQEDKAFIDKSTNTVIGQCHYEGLYAGRMSSQVHPVGFSTRAVMGYQKVTELVGGEGEGGKIEYTFYCEPDALPNFPGLPSQGSPLNGKLAQRSVFTAAGDLVTKETYSYAIKSTAALVGVKVFVSPAEQDASWASDGNIAIVNLGDMEGTFSSSAYQNPSSWAVVTTQTETRYKGKQELTSTRHFSYNNDQHKEITREQVTTSTGGSQVTHRLYPLDYADATGFIGEMKTAHVISTPVEQVTTIADNMGNNQQVLSASLTTYYTGAQIGLPAQQWNLKTVAPIPVAQFKFSNQAASGTLPTSTQTTFSLTGKDAHYPDNASQELAYDAQGQLQQVRRDKDVARAFLWGYGHALLVAEVLNATRQEVNTALSALGVDPEALPTDEQQLRTVFTQLRQKLPQARITGFTHQPLIGMTSQTDPSGRTVTYEYDGLGRLIRTRDEQGRILSQQQYHYVGQ